MVGKVVLLFVLMVGVATAAGRFSAAEYQSSFSQWMTLHRRSYTSSDFAARFAAFQSNLDFIEEFNSRNETFTVGLNHLSDLSVDEFRALLLKPFTRPARSLDDAPEFTGEGVRISRDVTVDWRTKGAVNPIKDQGQCGSCWTFSAAAAIESAYQISTGTLNSLSEQNLLDCVTQSNGCDGGSYMASFTYVRDNGGIATESSYPYTATKAASCGYSASNSGASISGYTRVASNDETALASAVYNQPVSVGIQADLKTFQSYKSGTYADSACTSANINHAVVAVGYGSDANGDYWIIRNSWGTYWGDKGYMQLQRGTNMCGVAAQGAFPTRSSSSTTKAPSTTTKAPSSTSAPSTTKAPSTSAPSSSTSSPSTTKAPSTTAGARSGSVFTDALSSGWTVALAGTGSGLTQTASGASGYGVSATISPGGAIVFTSSPALGTSAFTTFSFALKGSAYSAITFSIGSSSQNKVATTAFQTTSAALSSLGSPSSVSNIGFINSGSKAVTLTLDNIKFT